MRKEALLRLAGALLLASMACSGAAADEVGRFQVIPDAMVPGKGGKAQARAVLLDSETGRTWVLAPRKGKKTGPIWVPLDLKAEQAAKKEPAASNQASNQQRKKAKEVRSTPPGRPKFYEYDDNP